MDHPQRFPSRMYGIDNHCHLGDVVEFQACGIVEVDIRLIGAADSQKPGVGPAVVSNQFNIEPGCGVVVIGHHLTVEVSAHGRPIPTAKVSLAQYESFGLWRSLVAHITGGDGVAGSNPVSPTTFSQVRRLRGAANDAAWARVGRPRPGTGDQPYCVSLPTLTTGLVGESLAMTVMRLAANAARRSPSRCTSAVSSLPSSRPARACLTMPTAPSTIWARPATIAAACWRRNIASATSAE